MDCSLPGSSFHGILQARVLEWVAIPSPGDLPNPGIEPGSPAFQADALTSEPPMHCKLVSNRILLVIYAIASSPPAQLLEAPTWQRSRPSKSFHTGLRAPPINWSFLDHEKEGPSDTNYYNLDGP